jgi:hypothetical protein
MNKNKILAKIEPMVGKQFMIDGIVERITFYILQQNSISVETDSRKRSFSEDQFMEWAKKCLPVQDDLEVLEEDMGIAHGNSKMAPAVQNAASVNTVVYQPSFTSNNFSELRNILMKNIEKVQESKDYLPQAVAVRDNVQSVIELTKNEIEYAKVLNRMSR